MNRAEGLPAVAVVGRPNVGKSTLVNRLVGRREAIVEARPGVTRDRTSHAAEWRGRRFAIVDTGGWRAPGDPAAGRLDALVTAHAQRATEVADLVLFVVDATTGVTEEDAAVAGRLRSAEVPVLLVANKVDTGGFEAALAELYQLGLGDPVAVSALHGRGAGDLLDEVVDRLGGAGVFDLPAGADGVEPGVALIGRPNVGKSSLFNRLVGEERAIVDERPGTTRDTVDTVLTVDGRGYRFLDTAGLRRRTRKVDGVEYYSTVRTVRALESAAVGLLVVDASEPVAEQDQRLARQILDAGRAIVVVLNKWDLVDDDRRAELERERDRLLRFVDFAPLVRTSALSGRGVKRVLPAIDSVLAEWSKRIPTAALNQWLGDVLAASAPPARAGRGVRLRYVTQVAVGPPTFRFFATGPLPPAYERYLERRLREHFGFAGTPLVVGVRVRTRWEQRGRDGARPGNGRRRR
ncbi:MAG TPA: ribosome biogenesis GTPase Der [Egibacteraceae bacterium]|nr:ribosome biogenesis GTPase Der [Egibacteraceae bacterium]